MTTKGKTAASYSPEVRERAVRLVLEGGGDHPTQWAAINSVAAKIGCTAETLRKWVQQPEIDEGHRPGVTTDEAKRIAEPRCHVIRIAAVGRACERARRSRPSWKFYLAENMRGA